MAALMFTARSPFAQSAAHVARAGVQGLALAVVLAGCRFGGPFLELGLGPGVPGGRADSGYVVTGEFAEEGLLRVRLSVARWETETGPCSSNFRGTSCQNPVRLVAGEVITLETSAGTLSATTVTTGLDGGASFELTAPPGPITVTAEAKALEDVMPFTLALPFTQMRFGPVRDVDSGDFTPRQGVYVEFVDPDGGINEFAQYPPAVEFALVGCDAGVTLHGNGEGLIALNAPVPAMTRAVYFSFEAPAVDCRWTASAPGLEPITSGAFAVR